MARDAFGSFLNAMVKASARAQRERIRREKQVARAQRQAEIDQRRSEQEQRRSERENERYKKQAEKTAREHYIQSRLDKVEQDNEALQERIEDLKGLLKHTLSIDDTVSFDSLRIDSAFRPFSPPKDLVSPRTPPELADFTCSVMKPSFFVKWLPGVQSRYEERLEQARLDFEEAQLSHEKKEASRKEQLERLTHEYEAAKSEHLAKVKQRNGEIDDLEQRYKQGEREAIITYNSYVLDRSEYPEGFPEQFRLTYAFESKELVVDYELPGNKIIPDIAEYKYNKSEDRIETRPRKASETKELYQDVVSSIALRTVHEIFEADQFGHVLVVTFNGFVSHIDAATGKDARTCLISTRITKQQFAEINLSRIDKRVCLRNLGARVSAHPNELQPVKPIVEFDMVDKRFVDQGDVLSDLDSRPNLMDLKPFEFETLCSNLFSKMGLETKLTRSSKDGGVDVVAYDSRPVLGGKVVIQAKRYRNTVGVSAVRDLYGTMLNEGANKGILVATSGYGPDAFEFVRDKPIELIDGGGLLYLLNQAGIQARIIMPSDTFA